MSSNGADDLAEKPKPVHLIRFYDLDVTMLGCHVIEVT